MDQQRVRAMLRDFILTNFLPGEPPETLEDSTPLVSSGLIASLSMLEVATFIEEEFQLTLGPEDIGIERMDSIDLLVELVAKRSTSARTA